jgi:hypothetical protein
MQLSQSESDVASLEDKWNNIFLLNSSCNGFWKYYLIYTGIGAL